MMNHFIYTIPTKESKKMFIFNFRLEKKIWAKKYGADLVRFTHSSSAVICSSKNDFDRK